MAKTTEQNADVSNAKFEYRVWGKHRKARKLLAQLASEETIEEFEDCYFLVDDTTFNAKVRDSTLKVKQLVAEERGFERWTSHWHRNAGSAPSPFDELFEELRLDRHTSGKTLNLPKAVKRLDPETAAKAVFVTKLRRRYRIGNLRAEVTDITIESTGELLRTLAIEGSELDDLVALRKKLGLRGEENVAIHVAIDNDH